MLSAGSLDEKRDEIRQWLACTLKETYIGNPQIPPLEYILIRNSIAVFQKMIAQRNEKLAGFSFLQYLCDLLNQPDNKAIEPPAPGFFSEFEHLIRGIAGKSGIYDLSAPVFAKYKGRKAANLRSADLSRMARGSLKHMQKYSCGLDNDAIRRRYRNGKNGGGT